MKSAPIKETPLPSRQLTQAEKRAALQRLVDFLNHRKDRECALLGALGFSTPFIMRKTRLSQGQVGYRLAKAGIYRQEIRNGTSYFAKAILSSARQTMDVELEAHLIAHVPHYGQNGNGNGHHNGNGNGHHHR